MVAFPGKSDGQTVCGPDGLKGGDPRSGDRPLDHVHASQTMRAGRPNPRDEAQAFQEQIPPVVGRHDPIAHPDQIEPFGLRFLQEGTDRLARASTAAPGARRDGADAGRSLLRGCRWARPPRCGMRIRGLDRSKVVERCVHGAWTWMSRNEGPFRRGEAAGGQVSGMSRAFPAADGGRGCRHSGRRHPDAQAFTTPATAGRRLRAGAVGYRARFGRTPVGGSSRGGPSWSALSPP